MQHETMSQKDREWILSLSTIRRMLESLDSGGCKECIARNLGFPMNTMHETMKEWKEISNRTLSIDERMEIIQRLDNGEDPEHVATRFCINRVRVINIYRCKDMIMRRKYDQYHRRSPNNRSSEIFTNMLNFLMSNESISLAHSIVMLQRLIAGESPERLAVQFRIKEMTIFKIIEIMLMEKGRTHQIRKIRSRVVERKPSVTLSNFEAGLYQWYIKQQKFRIPDKLHRSARTSKANYEHVNANPQEPMKNMTCVQNTLESERHWSRGKYYDPTKVGPHHQQLMKSIEDNILSHLFEEVRDRNGAPVF